jgi:hypothetical protein
MPPLAHVPASLLPTLPVPFGRYRGAISEVNAAAWDASQRFRRRLQRKAWLFAGAFHEDAVVGFAIADVGYLGLAFCYYYDRKTKKLTEETAKWPFAFSDAFVPSLSSLWEFRKGQNEWTIEPSSEGWLFCFRGKHLEIALSVVHAFPGLTAIAPAAHRPFHSTYKLAALPSELKIRVEGKDRLHVHSLAVVDFTFGYPARRIQWNWAALCGESADHASVGINLVANFNEGLENAYWMGGEVFPLAQAEFHMGPSRSSDPWNLRTVDGKLELTFLPEGARSENVPLGFIQSRFIQPFGKFQGTLHHAGRVMPIHGDGIVEEHFALW